ncbi:MAG: hypothetical protein J0M00_08700 [Burkholderiales bacterium]|nr:hypothetical protein [Burkholderiales bacterium]
MNLPAPFSLKPLLALSLAVTLAACGGGDASPPPSPLQTSGFAVNGYLSGASVLCDSNGDGLVTAGEVSVSTTTAGLFVFPEGCSAPLVATGGTNTDTGQPFTGSLRAPAGGKYLTPLTTLLVAGMDGAMLNATLGLPEGTDVLNTDPAATDGAGTLVNPTLKKKTLAVQQLLLKTTEMLNGLTPAPDAAQLPVIYNEVANAFADYLKGGGRLNASDTAVDEGTVGALVRAATLRVRDAGGLPAAVRDAAKGVNADALAGVTAASLKIQADALLNATDTANVLEVVRAQQADTQVTAYVAANKSSLAGAPAADAVASMRQTLSQQVAASQGSGGNGGGGGGGGGGGNPGTGDTLLLSFDEATPAFSDMGAYGGALPSVEAGPSGGSGNALKILKPVSPDTWGGTFFTVARIPFTDSRKTISARVYSTRANAVIKFKVEVPGGNAVEVASAPTGAANTWSTVTWNLSSVNPALAYTLIAITPDSDTVTSGQAYYIDSISLQAATVTPPPSGGGSVLLSFDESTPAFSDMGAYGGALPTVEAGPTGGSGNALKILKPASPDTWGGTFFTVARIPFASDRKVLSARVYATRANAVVTLKVEVPGGSAVEVQGTPTGAANTWSTVTWNLAAVDPALAYTVIAITPDVSRTTDGQAYYIDTLTLDPATASPPTPPSNVDALLLSFDEGVPAFSNMGAYGGALPTVEAGPAGGSGNALKVLKPVNPDTWGGVFFNVATIPFASDRKVLSARVYSSRADAVIKLKVEVPGGAGVEVASAPTGPANTWSTVTWNLAGVNPGQSYQIIAITPDAERVTDGQTYWIDEIKLLAAGSGPVVAQKTIATFEEPGARLAGFEGAWDATVVNDPLGGVNKVGRILKPGTNVANYAGATIVTVANGGFTPIPFTSTAKTMTVRVYSPDAGIPVRLKIEDIADGSKYVEADTVTSAAGAWQTLTFNFAAPASGSPALDLATTYNKVSIFFDFGTIGSGKTYFFDDINFVGAGGNVPVATFDELPTAALPSPPVLTGFGGAEDSTIVAPSGMPAGGNGKAAKVVKAAGEIWAGTSVQRKANDAVPTIPFATGATKMTLRVYSTYPPGIRVRMKVEQSGRPDINSEVDAYTASSNAWETLTFDFGPAGKHFVPNGPGPNDYNTNLPTAQLDVSKVYNKVNIFFDYGLGDGGYAPMPDTRVYYFDELKFIGN